MLFLRVITTIPMLFVNFNIDRNRWKSVTEERFTEKKVIEAYVQTFKKLRRLVDRRYYHLRLKQKNEKEKRLQKIMFFINLNFLLIFTLFRILDISTTIVGMKTLDIPVLNPIMASMYENNFPLVILFNVIFVLIFLVATLFAYKKQGYIAIAFVLSGCFSVFIVLNYLVVINNFRVLIL